MIRCLRRTFVVANRFAVVGEPAVVVVGISVCRHKRNMSNVSVDLSALRQPYREDDDVLLESTLPTKDPIKLFELWFNEIKSNDKSVEANAVCVSTCTKDGIPSSRMVLLKQYGSDGFVFFTNLLSRKGQELTENPRAALLFYWASVNRQVRIEGPVEQVSPAEAKKYFESRPKRSQVAAALSQQSKPVSGRDELISRYNELEKKHADDTFLTRPDYWGGFRVIPKVFEFWQGQSSRLHDRIVFRSKNEPSPEGLEKHEVVGDWIIYRIQP
ncbi:putative pyridoxamine 5'-phosphate oxidase [Brevipalpus obovatus]|uniref:putative pyridoxamine 5'-phosphate oxidase n=1 Tax=Brevipalpus obovatus TaxID=246614 RepID=UPI003D9E4255